MAEMTPLEVLQTTLIPSLSTRSRLAMAAMMISIAMAVLDTAIANTALPTISEAMSITPAESIWIINAYQLSAVTTLLPFAALGSVIGHRRVYLIGLSLFVLASGFCAMSDSLWQLVLARLLQGIGGSAVMSVNTALIARLYPTSILGRGLGINALVVGVASAIGPTVASVILSFASWEWLFAINVPIGLIAIIFSSFTLPHSEFTSHGFDKLAAALTSVAFAALIFGLSSAAQEESAYRTVTTLGVAASALTVLAFVERGKAAPILPLDLLREPVFGLSALTAFCAFATQGLAFVALPFYLEHTFSMSVDQTGFVLSPWSAVVALIAPVAGRLCDKIAPGLLGGAGLAMLAAGMGFLTVLPTSTPVGILIGCFMICGAGFGFFQSPNQKAIMSSAPSARAGGASGVIAIARLIGQATGAALVALCFGIAGISGPTLALAFGCAFSAIGAVASVLRLLFHS
jgi:DHA2 family multidrug resistance protein-like MFS transporter